MRRNSKACNHGLWILRQQCGNLSATEHLTTVIYRTPQLPCASRMNALDVVMGGICIDTCLLSGEKATGIACRRNSSALENTEAVSFGVNDHLFCAYYADVV